MASDPTAQPRLLALTMKFRERADELLAGDEPGAGEGRREWLGASLPLPSSGDAESTPLLTVERAFQLSRLEYAVLLALLAAELEPNFRFLLRSQQREGGKPWLELGTIADLLRLGRDALPDLFELFLPTAKLRTSGLVLTDETGDAGEIPMIHLRAKVTRRLLRHCLGSDELPGGMRFVAEPREILAESLLAEKEKSELLSRLRYALLARIGGGGEEASERLVVALHGIEGVGKKFLAEGLAAELGRAMLFVDVRAWGISSLQGGRQLAQLLADVERETLLADAVPYLDRWDLLMDDGAGEAPPPPSIDPEDARPSAAPRRPLPTAFVQYLERRRDLVFLGANDRFAQLDRVDARVRHIGVGFPGPLQRGRLWQRAVATAGAELAEGIDVDELGRKFALDPARIVAATRSAVEQAGLAGSGGAVTLDREHIFSASREQLQHELASLAVRVTKTHKWEDLVIPVEVYESMQELLSYVRHSAEVYEEQGFGARHSIQPGLSALFAGPPGTGKTMCASIVARELEMELFRVDLSRVVSKWIGETEKNLAKVFDEAQRSHAVILFDEADSLFAKRTEVKSSIDRYANLEVSYLLQRMEQFSGITVLTTNFEDTIDPAFKRRITFKMRFERPDADARAALWAKMFPPKARLGDDLDFGEIGRRFELSGGSIRNAVVRAAFLAADAGTAILQQHILVAAAREAREMGALVSEARRTVGEQDGEHAADPDRELDAEDEELTQAPRPPRMIPISHPRR